MSRRRRTKAQITFNMSRVRSAGSEIERVMESALRQAKLHAQKHPDMFGRPDFVFPLTKIAVFCDSHFWHGYRWAIKKKEIKKNRTFWLPKILGNMRRDRTVNRRLRAEGWTVLRFWEHNILRSTDRCVAKIKAAIDMSRIGT
jgi:DNA mismatch endonuclease Vsr